MKKRESLDDVVESKLSEIRDWIIHNVRDADYIRIDGDRIEVLNENEDIIEECPMPWSELVGRILPPRR